MYIEASVLPISVIPSNVIVSSLSVVVPVVNGYETSEVS
jgi:hypothetical protein